MRSVKSLATAAEAGRHQREWFADLRRRVADGEPFALLNADVPHEIFRTMDIPYAVSQWWASLVAAKQRSGHYLELVRQRGYPDYSEQYNAVTLGSAFDPEPEAKPVGRSAQAGHHRRRRHRRCHPQGLRHLGSRARRHLLSAGERRRERGPRQLVGAHAAPLGAGRRPGQAGPAHR